MEETSERSIFGRHQSCYEERIAVLSDLEGTLSFFKKHFQPCCIPKVVRLKTGEVLYEKAYMSLRPPPKMSLKHDWMKELGSEVAQRPDEQVVQQSKSSQSNQRNPNQIMIERGNPLSAVTQVTSQLMSNQC